MQIKIAKTAGFCFGVKRAMDIVLGISNKPGMNVYTDGPLIHNPQIIKVLENRNITVLKNDDEIKDSTVVIRAHGIPPERLEFLEKRCSQVIDGTCPLVYRIHKVVMDEIKKGRFVIIIGESGHPEVIGILGFARTMKISGSGSDSENIANKPDILNDKNEEKKKDAVNIAENNNADGNSQKCDNLPLNHDSEEIELRGVVINSVSEVENLGKIDYPVSVVAQSTQELEHFDKVCAAIKSKFGEVNIFNTICNATKMRQEEAAALAREVDLMVVVGGKNSGNTKRLAEVCQKEGTRTIFVETEAEVCAEEIKDANVIGITAGASTPNWMIRNVAQKIEDISFEKRNFLLRFFRKFVNFLIDSNIYIGIGAFSMAYVASLLTRGAFHPFETSLAALYIFSMHTLNRYIDRDAGRYNDSRRSAIYEKYTNYVTTSALLATFIVILFSYTCNKWLFLFYVTCSVSGILYSINFVPVSLRSLIGYSSFKDIPASRDIFLSTAWAVVLTFSPVVSGRWAFEWKMLFTFAIVFIFAFCRTIILDIKDIQGDSIVGKETIPTLIEIRSHKLVKWLNPYIPVFAPIVPTGSGSRYSVKLMKSFLLAGIIILICGVALKEYDYSSLVLILNFGYVLVAINKFGREGSFYGNFIEGFVDFNFILAGILMYLTVFILSSI